MYALDQSSNPKMDWNIEKAKKPSKYFLQTAPFDKLCRTCLSLCIEKEKIFNIFDAAHETIKLHDIFRSCISVQVKENDGFPQHVCESCMGTLLQFYMFVQQSEQSDILLREVVSERGRDLTSTIAEVNAPSKVSQICNQQSQKNDNAHNILIHQDTNKNQTDSVDTYVGADPNTPLLESHPCNRVDIKSEPKQDLYITQETTGNWYTTSQLDKCSSTLWYLCSYCEESFATFNELKQHRKEVKHPRPRNHPCEKCSKAFTTTGHLQQHMASHAGETQFSSKNSNSKTEQNEQTLENNTSNPISDRPFFACKQCNELFDSHNKLKTHWKLAKHPRSRNHTCTECKKLFVSNSRLQQHMRTHTKEKPYNCCVCQMQFSQSFSFRRHMMRHTGERPHVCDVCGKGYIQAENLVEHRKLHTGEAPFICDHCGRRFRNRISYRVHVEGHLIKTTPVGSNEKSLPNHECDTCQRKFTTKAVLKTHMLIHGEKNFLCNHCGKGFVHKGGLVTHMKVHTGIKPYACKECKKEFKQLSAVKAHARIHTGERPFACKLCLKAFTAKHHLVSHMKTHSKEKPFKCSICSKLFTFKMNLTAHVRIHTGETPFICNVCGKGFNHSNNMKKHQKVHEKGSGNTGNKVGTSN